MRFAVIAEDTTDCDAIGVLIKRIAANCGAPTPGVKKMGQAGCARIPKKLAAHLGMCAENGCTAAIVAHDLDRDPRTMALNSEIALRAKLAGCLGSAQIQSLICIPIEELEAWFWSDQAVINVVAGRTGKAKAHAEPHRIARPKEELQKLSRAENRKPRYSTNDNERLAGLLDIDLCASRCPAFKELRDFVTVVCQTVAPP